VVSEIDVYDLFSPTPPQTITTYKTDMEIEKSTNSIDVCNYAK